MTTKKVPIQIRQGDVLLVGVDHIPPGATELPPDPARGHVLAEGEATGHAHRIPQRYAGGATAYRTETDARYMRVTAPVPLRHEEHKTQCHPCAGQGVVAIATHRRDNGFAREDYRCGTHAEPGDLMLAEPGATEIPPLHFERVIHAEYQPGAVPRNVED